jgi:hypothetical protein
MAFESSGRTLSHSRRCLQPRSHPSLNLCGGAEQSAAQVQLRRRCPSLFQEYAAPQRVQYKTVSHRSLTTLVALTVCPLSAPSQGSASRVSPFLSRSPAPTSLSQRSCAFSIYPCPSSSRIMELPSRSQASRSESLAT